MDATSQDSGKERTTLAPVKREIGSMKTRFKQFVALIVMVMAMSTQLLIPQQAEARYRRPITYANVAPGYYGYRRPGVYQRHPIVSRTLTGTAIGALGGLAVGAIAGHHRAGRGALIGAGVGTAAGLAYGLYRNKQYTGRIF